jgi:DNA-binding HxlR family transcriptional regulator
MRALSHTPVGIRDIADKVLGCSEKTLQRELNTLVDSGLVNRIGEKRWSKYVLA